ncbi:hypothetical protein NQ318_002654, partial [Aromia moschata]
INHWTFDKERLVLLTAKSLVLVKYDFIALKPFDYKKISTNIVNEEKLRNLYNLDLFIDHLCTVITKMKENSIILHHNILLENYIGLGSIIHNRNSLGFFKVRGKFSF